MQFTAILRGLIGLAVMVGIAFILSNNKSKVGLRVILWGIGLQFLFALMILPANRLTTWGAGFVFLSMVLIHAFENRYAGNWEVKAKVNLAGSVILGFAACVFVLWGIARAVEPESGTGLLKTLLWTSVIVMFLGFFIKNNAVRFLGFAATVPVGVALAILTNTGGQEVLQVVARGVESFLRLTDKGSRFLFGNLADSKYFFTDGSSWPGFGYQFAFYILPTIIFFSAFISILYYLGAMQFIVGVMAKFMRWTMGTSGAETLSCTANIFVGQTEAPLLIQPYLADMTTSELHAVMVGGFATIAGGVMAAYISFGIPAGHLIAASVMSAPAALAIAKVMHPETEHSKTAGDVEVPDVERPENILDAISKGVVAGLQLALNVAAMLIAFLALIALVDWILGALDAKIDGQWSAGVKAENGEYVGWFPGSLRSLFGGLFAPIAWCLGADWGEWGKGEAFKLGNLLGTKISANEFIAYSYLGDHIKNGTLSYRVIVIATYALCGFANFGSIGIQIGGIGALAPERRTDLTKLGLRAMIAGALASWMTAAIAGMLVGGA